MNEDYLWDKTGHDPEIEEFENALREFGYRQTTTAPALPAKIVSFPGKTSSNFFRYAMAAAACFIFFAVSLGIWLQFSSQNSDDETVAEKPAEQPARDEFIPAPIAKSPEHSPAKSIENSGQTLKGKSIETAGRVLPVVHKNIAKVQNFRHAKQPVRLTEEEEFAYSQLRLALSITGSKLKLIRDKIENDESSVKKNGR